MNADTGFDTHIVTAMDTKISCHACGALGFSTRACIQKSRNGLRMGSLGNREIGTRPIAKGVQVGAIHPLGIANHQRHMCWSAC
jgi:hypothetical protein